MAILDNFSLFVVDAVKSFGYTGRFEHIDGKVVNWHDFKSPPTDKELQDKVDELVAEHEKNQYQRDRQYPELGEQLDMLFHDMTADKGDKTGEWYKAVAKVKSDNPKE